MTADLISKKTRVEFREYFVGTTPRVIESEFDSANIPCATEYGPNESGDRRCLVEQYYHSIDWSKWADVRKVATVYENVLSSLERSGCLGGHEWAANAFNSLKKSIESDGFKYEGGKLTRQQARE